MDAQKIIFSGGGTLGSVTPLLAVYEELQRDNPADAKDYLWLGTKLGPESQLINQQGIRFKSIVAGKFRRYFSLRNFVDPFFVIVGFFQALMILRTERPDWVLTAGGFVAVPVAWAAWILRIPVAVHQQDVIPGLANKLMLPTAKLVTVTFEHSLQEFKHPHKHVTGNPVRHQMLSQKPEVAEFKRQFNITSDKPIVLVVGGGTGALFLNKLIRDSVQHLISFCEVIHLTGGKSDTTFEHPQYHQYEFLKEKMFAALQVADLVVTRAGMSSLSELSVLGKPCIIVPIPDSHQEANARIFARHNAALVADQDNITADSFIESIKLILNDSVRRDALSANIRRLNPVTAAETYVGLLKRYGKK